MADEDVVGVDLDTEEGIAPAGGDVDTDEEEEIEEVDGEEEAG